MSNQYIGNDLIELVKHLSDGQNGRKMPTCEGHITSVDQDKYMAKVLLEPYGVETGWLPIGTVGAGPGWGFFHLPPDGTQVDVEFIGGDVNNGRIKLCYSNTTDAPPTGLVQGEFLLRHSSGSYLRFHNSGLVELITSGDLTATANGNVSIAGTSVNLHGTSNTTINSSGPISLSCGGATSIEGKNFLSHTHSDPQGGSTGGVL